MAATKAKQPGVNKASQRMAERRAALIAKGYAQKNWLLPPDALKDLAVVVKRHKITETEAIERALAAYVEPDTQPSDDELVSILAHRLRLAERAK